MEEQQILQPRDLRRKARFTHQELADLLSLDKDEVAAGFILSCQAHPLTERVVITEVTISPAGVSTSTSVTTGPSMISRTLRPGSLRRATGRRQ